MKHTFEYDDATDSFTADPKLISVISQRAWTLTMDEASRQSRWHSTRDAVIASIANGQWKTDNYGALAGIDAEAIVLYATRVADKAHGPLVRS